MVTDTSIESYRRLDVARNDDIVLTGLIEMLTDNQNAPTGYELTNYLKFKGLVFDLNNVRPALTRMSQKGLVLKAAKRPCTVTGRLAYTWVLANDGVA